MQAILFSLVLVFSTKLCFASVGSAIRAVCTSYSSDICISGKFAAEPNSKDEGKFVLELQIPPETEAQNVKVDLWMQMGDHGHGSAPLKIAQIGPHVFAVENAWFVMKGQWQVRVDFEMNNEAYKFILPVKISQ
jgi:hypothetical protein